MTYFEKIVDLSTGEEIIRPFTEDEIRQVEKNQERIRKEMEVEEKTAKARAAVLERLGITEEEAKLLLG